jgi:putative ABC transport system substrate-binding protein
VKRRDFLLCVGAAPWLLRPRVSRAEDKIARIGFLARALPEWSALRGLDEGLRERGYVEGKNIRIERRYTLAFDDLSSLAAELVRGNPDVIVTFGTPSAVAARNATKTIPIVFTAAGDPLATGLAASLARPGGNATGVSIISTELSAKRLDLLRQLAPRLRKATYLSAVSNPVSASGVRSTQAAAKALQLKLNVVNVRRHEDVAAAIGAISWKSIGGLVVDGDPIFLAEGARIAEAVRKARVPAVFPWRQFQEYGVVMIYDTDLKDVLRRGAYFVDRILKGASPAELPVEQVSTTTLIIDLRAAREQKIDVPAELVYRADQVIR